MSSYEDEKIKIKEINVMKLKIGIKLQGAFVSNEFLKILESSIVQFKF